MTKLIRENLTIFKERVGRLEPDAVPRWGRMDAELMVRHLRRALEISLGEVEVPDRSIPGLRTILRVLFFQVFTIWPPSISRVPDYWLPPPEGGLSVERDQLVRALERFVELLEEQPGSKSVHSILGQLTLRSWSQVHGVHFAHHFRQFRV